MKLSFQWKIRIVICLLSVSLTSLGVYYFYTAAYQMALGLLRKNLRDVGNVGTMLFDRDSREAIKRLKALAVKEAVFDRQVIDALPSGGTTRTISPEKIKELHASDDFQMILHRLKMISHASYKDAVPLLKNYEIEIFSGVAEGMIGTYLVIGSINTLPEDIYVYLASASPEPTANGWPGNPIGNLFRGFYPWSKTIQKIHIFNELIIDEYYQSLSGTVPIWDDNNQVIAILGLDYAVGSELNKLDKLKWLCFALIISSFVLALLISSFISRVLNAPLRQLHNAAKKVSQDDYTERVDIKSADEFGLLGRVFNQMLINIQTSFRSLEMKNKQLSSVVADMHDGVGSILTSIALTSQVNDNPAACEKLQPINRLAQQGLSEVRFLMDALEYKECDLSTIVEEVEMLAVNMLRPTGIIFAIRHCDNLSEQKVDFDIFLELQRVFREAFTNIIKHSNADHCKVEIELADSVYCIRIKDNGNRPVEKSTGLGRGLKSIAIRIEHIRGTVEYKYKEGFQIEMKLPKKVLYTDCLHSNP